MIHALIRGWLPRSRRSVWTANHRRYQSRRPRRARPYWTMPPKPKPTSGDYSMRCSRGWPPSRGSRDRPSPWQARTATTFRCISIVPPAGQATPRCPAWCTFTAVAGSFSAPRTPATNAGATNWPPQGAVVIGVEFRNGAGRARRPPLPGRPQRLRGRHRVGAGAPRRTGGEHRRGVRESGGGNLARPWL